VEDSAGDVRPAHGWLLKSARPLLLRDAKVTEDRFAVPAVVVVHARGMKEPWCLETSRRDAKASEVVKRYGRRFTIEETFRDTRTCTLAWD